MNKRAVQSEKCGGINSLRSLSHLIHTNFGVLRNFPFIQISHREHEVEIVPVQEAVLDVEFAEAFPVVICLHRRMLP